MRNSVFCMACARPTPRPIVSETFSGNKVCPSCIPEKEQELYWQYVDLDNALRKRHGDQAWNSHMVGAGYKAYLHYRNVFGKD